MQQNNLSSKTAVAPLPSEEVLRFSRHAQTRMIDRGIELTANQWRRLGQAVQSLRARGGRNTLILLDRIALVVSIKNRRVITIVDRQTMRDNIFTNIDSAMLA
jgi:flagellar operon protein